MHYAIAIVASVALSLSVREASAQIAFEHHYISTTYPKLSGFGQSVSGDFNNDGRTDYLIGQHFGTREKRQYLFVNNGTTQDWPFYMVTTDNTADGGVNALDVDRDGWLDIVSSGSWFKNNRTPTTGPFTKYVYDSASYGGHDMVIADIDHDGKPDVVVNTDKGDRNGGENGLFWFKIPADATQVWKKTRIGPAVHSGVWPAGIGDIDGDGDLDVFNRAWYENADGKGGKWIEHDNVGFGRRGRFGFSQQSALVDVDGDGDGDIDVFAAESEWMATRARWFIWENVDGKGTFVRRTILEGLGAHNAVVADVDGDGDLDILNKEFAPAKWNLLGGGQHVDFLENKSAQRR